MNSGIIGTNSLDLRFNIVARIQSRIDVSLEKARELVNNLPQIEHDDTPKYQTTGFKPVELVSIEHPCPFEQNIINQLITFEFERSYTGKRGLVVQQALIFWIFPDIFIFCGEKGIVRRAFQRIEYELSEVLGDVAFKAPEFEWYYYLRLFEILERKKQWIASNRSTEPPSTEIAKGVEMSSIHDVDAEWEKESPQAKKVSAKKAGDSTEDISTAFSIIQGRPMKAVALFVTMEGEGCLVKLGAGGRILVRKKVRTPKEGEEPRAIESKRIVWGLEFASRLLEAYEDWKKLPVDKMLPSGDIYEIIHGKVSDLNKILRRELKKRLAELEKLRKELKRRKKK